MTTQAPSTGLEQAERPASSDDSERTSPPPRRRRSSQDQASRWAAAAFMAPLLAYLVAFYAYPLARSIDLSLRDYTLSSFITGEASFVGLANFREVLADATFSAALRNTMVFTLVSIFFQYAIGLALAVFFKGTFKLSGLLRALFLVPWLLPLIVSASAWSWMFNSDNGIINTVLGFVGIDAVTWLTSPDTALVSVIIANIWLGIPFNLVILYSGLQNIPDEVYEAAEMDGASGWQRFWQITFPMLRPVTLITLLLGLIYTLKVVDIIWIMTRGGPGDASTTFATWSYREAFGAGLPEFSTAAAVGNVLILLALVAGFIYIRIQRREESA